LVTMRSAVLVLAGAPLICAVRMSGSEVPPPDCNPRSLMAGSTSTPMSFKPSHAGALAAITALLVLSAAMAAPWLLARGSPAIAVVLYRGFALVCHQRPERCFWIFGAPVAVCARCLGIYMGAAFGLLLRTSRTIAMRMLIAAAAINLLDAAAEFTGLHGNWMWARFVLGLALGAAGGLMISSSMPVRTPVTAKEAA